MRKMERNSVCYEGSETRGQEPIGRQQNQQGAGSFAIGRKELEGYIDKVGFQIDRRAYREDETMTG